MKHRKYRILSILLLACLALQAVIPGAWAEAAPEGWETLAPAETVTTWPTISLARLSL